MSASTVRPWVNEMAVKWPGVAAIDRVGARIARDLLSDMEDIETDKHGVNPGEYCALADWPRHGRPFRNAVAEYAARAQAAGREALAGFYAVLSDFLSSVCQGSVPDVGNYDRFCGDERPS